jgi:hypothetical protein
VHATYSARIYHPCLILYRLYAYHRYPRIQPLAPKTLRADNIGHASLVVDPGSYRAGYLRRRFRQWFGVGTENQPNADRNRDPHSNAFTDQHRYTKRHSVTHTLRHTHIDGNLNSNGYVHPRLHTNDHLHSYDHAHAQPYTDDHPHNCR